jgi:nucleotide-binding universal stress UspA family protein
MTTPAGPFTSILVPYDGAEPSQAALALAFRLLGPTSRLVVVTVVNEAPLISESAVSVAAYDPTELFEAMDEEGRVLLADAVSRCAVAKVTPITEMVHDTPVPAILAAAKKHACDLIVMGTHGRTGIGRFFLGSTTEGVLRQSDVPVLTIRAAKALG